MDKRIKDESAQVGIGTMIVFIATILVAAVAAGVLIDTSQKLQDKSTRTGTEATNDVGSTLEVLKVYGERDQLDNAGVADSDEALDSLRVQVRLAAGADDMDLSKLKIQFNDGTSANFAVYKHGAAISATEFTATWLSGTGTDSVMQSGDIVEFQIGDSDTDGAAPDLQLALAKNTNVDLKFLPEEGNDVSVGFTTPVTYGSDKIFTLF